MALGSYRKALEQRNRLLRDLRDGHAPASARQSLPAWNESLTQHGARLIERRRLFLDRLALLAAETHSILSDGRDTLEVCYLPSFPLGDLTEAAAIQARFLEALASVSGEETARGTTVRGPQRDDITFLVNGQDCRLFGSQGQQRTVALSLKLAERRLIEELVGEPPLLLLDDVLSDLDDARRSLLFDLTAAAGSQTFLSCTNLRAFSPAVLDTRPRCTPSPTARWRSSNFYEQNAAWPRLRGRWKGSLKSQELAAALRPHLAKVHWAEVVGPQVAGVTQVEAVRSGVLFVRVKNSVWANELTLLKDDMVRRLNQKLGGAGADRYSLQGKRPGKVQNQSRAGKPARADACRAGKNHAAEGRCRPN